MVVLGSWHMDWEVGTMVEVHAWGSTIVKVLGAWVGTMVEVHCRWGSTIVKVLWWKYTHGEVLAQSGNLP